MVYNRIFQLYLYTWEAFYKLNLLFLFIYLFNIISYFFRESNGVLPLNCFSITPNIDYFPFKTQLNITAKFFPPSFFREWEKRTLCKSYIWIIQLSSICFWERKITIGTYTCNFLFVLIQQNEQFATMQQCKIKIVTATFMWNLVYVNMRG